MNKHIILVTGHKLSGKDTLADKIIQQVPSMNREEVIQKLSFATSLKLVCCKLLNAFYNSDEEYFTLERLSDPLFKEQRLMKYRFNRKPLVLRDVMQYVGTDILRKLLSEDIFAQSIVQRIRSDESKFSRPQHYIIADFRFLNEYETLQRELGDQYNITVIRVHRSCVDRKVYSHRSETEMDTPEFKKLVNFSFRNENSFTEIDIFANYICKKLGMLPQNYNELIDRIKKEL